jgi:DNA-binding CsgD family transcriptional regulator
MSGSILGNGDHVGAYRRAVLAVVRSEPLGAGSEGALSALEATSLLLDAARADVRAAHAGGFNSRIYQLARISSGHTEELGFVIEADSRAVIAFESDGPRVSILASIEDAIRLYEATGVTLTLAAMTRATRGPSTQQDPSAQAGLALAPRERELVTMVMQGKTNKEIGAELYLSERTIKNRLTTIYRKMGVKDRTQMAILARELSLVPPEPM